MVDKFVSPLCHTIKSDEMSRPGQRMCALLLSGASLVGASAVCMQAVAASAYVQSAAHTDRVNNSVQVTFASPQQAGDLNVVFIGWLNTRSHVVSVTDTKGNVYSLANTVSLPGTATEVVYYSGNIVGAAANGNSVTVTFNSKVYDPDVRIGEYSGIDSNRPLDVAMGASGISSITTSGLLTTTNPDDLLVASNFSQRSITGPGSGYTERLIDNYAQILEDKNVTQTGQYSATAPQSKYGWYVMQVLAFQSEKSTAPIPPPPPPLPPPPPPPPYPSSPYSASSILGGISWAESGKQRYAVGSDIWDSTWASDGLIYGVWGDGYGFASLAKAQIGVSSLAGSPASPPLMGIDAYIGSPSPPAAPCAQRSTLGGKSHGVVGLPDAVIYLFHSTQDLCVNQAWLAKSTNNGIAWIDYVGGLQWPDASGFSPVSILQYGLAQSGGLMPDGTFTQYIYIYAGKNNPGNQYLARVPASPSNAIESSSQWSYYAGTDSSGNPTWASSSASAVPVWSDSNYAESLVVTFNPAIGRYIAYNDHGNACGGSPCERQVSLYDAPSPWGPWTTFDYEEQFDNVDCGSNCLGDQAAVGWGMMQKWFSTDGLSIWVGYSSVATYDSLNLIQGRISLAPGSTVTNLVVSTGTPAVVDTLSLSNPGNLEFIDRPDRLTSIPAAYVGKEVIRLAKNDEGVSDMNYLSFTSTIAQNVCVAWDSVNTLPEWLSTWTNTGQSLVGSATFNLYRNAFSPGTVTIPGAAGSDGYILIVGC